MYYSADYVKDLLEKHPYYKEKLFCRGFLITDKNNINLNQFPFYGNWNKVEVCVSEKKSVYLYTHKLIKCYTYKDNENTFFIVGHAYNPYTMEHDENDILKSLSIALKSGKKNYWEKESELTGVFCQGFINKDGIVFSTDCTGMQLVYYGTHEENMFITSHSKLVADLCGFSRDKYITDLVHSKFYRYFGTWLPSDLSPFKELKRVTANFETDYSFADRSFSFSRFYPYKKVQEIDENDEKAYNEKICEISDVIAKNIQLIAKKWPNKRTALSVTGGRDSTTTLACANGTYDKLTYFSYISNIDEEVDALAAKDICKYIGIPHKIYKIPDESELYNDIDVAKVVFECNAGCVGHNNLNDVKKRIYFDHIDDFDVEIKSWINELSRAEAHLKYNTSKFPKKPTPGYWRCMWKVIVNPKLIRQSNKIFKEHLEKYYSEEVLSYLDWTDYFFWEFSWGAGEGLFLTSEHKYSYDITIPFNNRKLLNTIFTVPLQKRMDQCIPQDIINTNNKKIADSNILIKDISHTDNRATLLRTYLRVFSKF